MMAAGCGREAADSAGAKGGGGKGPGGPPPEPVLVVLAPSRLGTLERTVEVVGTLFGDEEATISAKVPGRIAAIYADIGDRVDPRGPLAEVDPVDYRLAVAQREAALSEALAGLDLRELPPPDFNVDAVATVERAQYQAANAKAKLERARKLFEQRPPLISEQDFADLETAFEVAERDHEVARLEARSQLALARTRSSELESARQRLADTVLRAPPRGPSTRPGEGDAGLTTQRAEAKVGSFAVSAREVSVGEYVREGDAVFRLVADDPIKFRGVVPERYTNEMRVGQPAIVRVDGLAEPAHGTISRVNPAIDAQSRTFQIEALIPNRNGRLRPGAFGQAIIRVGEDPAVTFVPMAAVVSFAGVDKVFTVSEGKAIEHVVLLGPRRDDDHIAIREGLEGDPPVVTTGAAGLAKGVPVQLADAAPTTQNIAHRD